jgi:hypothetical protein
MAECIVQRQMERIKEQERVIHESLSQIRHKLMVMSGFKCPHCGETADIFKSGGGRDMASAMGIPFLGAIPIEPSLVQLTDAGVRDRAEIGENGWSASFRGVVGNLLQGLAEGASRREPS